MQYEKDSLKVVKKLDKETTYGSRILAVLPNAILLADMIQGVQIISLPNLTPVKAWRI